MRRFISALLFLIAFLHGQDNNVFISRRIQLFNNLNKPFVLAICSGKDLGEETEKPYPFFPESNFFYLSGLSVPSTLLMISSEPLLSSDTSNAILLVPALSRRYFTWNTNAWDKEQLKSISGISSIYRIDEIPVDTIIERTIRIGQVAYLQPPTGCLNTSSYFFTAVNDFQKLIGVLDSLSVEMFSEQVTGTLTRMREIKNQEEINFLTRAAQITCGAIEKLLRVIQNDLAEEEISSIFKSLVYSQNATICFEPIIASGPNTLILHHHSGKRKPQKGELILMDVGAYYNGYCVDMTRTFPFSGSFTPQQDTIYRIVLEALRKAISSIVIGREVTYIHSVVIKTLQEELLKRKIIREPQKIYSLMPHASFHSIGIDVHEKSESGVFRPGQVFAIEPGIYIKQDSTIPPQWWNIGIRIEETVLITEAGVEILTSCIPSAPEKISALLNKKHEITIKVAK